MENNAVKENFLEITKSKEIVTTIAPNVLPVIAEDRSALLPMVIPDIKITFADLKKQYQALENHKTQSRLKRFIKTLIKFIAKMVRFSYLLTSNIIIIISVAVVIVTSIAIITKNAVNAYYNIEQDDEHTYTVFEMRNE